MGQHPVEGPPTLTSPGLQGDAADIAATGFSASLELVPATPYVSPDLLRGRCPSMPVGHVKGQRPIAIPCGRWEMHSSRSTFPQP